MSPGNMRAQKCLLLFGVVFLFASTTSARKINMKINVGGGAVGDFSGEDEFLQFGEEAVKTRFHGNIQGSGKDLEVFETQRFSREEDLVIDVAVPDGIYVVTLLFAETWDGAFEAGKRMFDVYLGSKPTGVVKVTQNFDPFQAGGRAAPVRKKYRGIATYGGLTIALRPIKQNPQIAGIVVSGFSYSEPLLDELPTVAGDLSEVEDFSILSNIGPRLPADRSNLYDPSLNPKLAEEPGTQAFDPSDTFSSTQETSLRSRTTLQDQQKPFTSPGHLSSANSKLQESLFSPSSPSGYGQHSSDRIASQSQTFLGSSNSFSDRPSPQLQTSSGTFRPLIPLMGTVRAVADTVGSSGFLSGGKHKIIPNHKTGLPNGLRSAHRGHRRHGRQLTSIPAEDEAVPLLIGQGSSQSIIPDQGPLDSSSRKVSSSNYLSQQPRPGVSGTAPSDYTTSRQSVEKLDKEKISSGQTTGYIGPMDVRAAFTSNQIKQDTGRASVDRQGQDRMENERNMYQVQKESIASSSPSSPIGDNSGSTGLNSGSQSTIASRSNESQKKSIVAPLNPGEHESNVHAYHQISFSDALGSQESARQLSQGPTQGEFPPVPSFKFPGQQSSQQIRPRAEHLEEREGVQPKVNGGEGSVQVSEMGRVGDLQHFDLISGSRGYGSQRDAEVSELHGSRMAQPVERDPLLSASQRIQGSTFPSATGMPVGSVSSSTSSLQKRQGETQNSANGMSGAISKESDSTEIVSHTERAFVGSGEVVRRASDPATEGERGENYRTISSRSAISASSDQVSGSSGSSRFYSADSKERQMMPTNVPSPGVHNGNEKLDGLCIHNSTHCSCGMVDQIAEAPEECLFVVDENMKPMACVTRPCSGKVVCACAPGASALCKHSVVKSILVRATMTPSEGTEDPIVVACKREALEDGVMILTPII